MKRKAFYLILALMAITTIAAIYNGSDIIPQIATMVDSNRNEKYTKPQENTDQTPMFNMNEPIETKDQTITILETKISKKIDKFPVFEGFQDFLDHPPYISKNKSFDKNCNFIDNNNYLQLMVTWENNKDITEEQYLNCMKIYTEKGEGYLSLEPWLISTNTKYPKKNLFGYTFKPKEKLTFYMGYVITNEEVEKYKDSMCISFNINGTALFMEDKDRRTIKLKID